jgi:NDP-sugar pyrophosphorylase family protein
MENFFSENDFGIPIKLIHEKNILGTGGGIINAKEFLFKSDYCIIVNTDIITDFNPSDIIASHQSSVRDVTLLIQKRNSKKYLSFDNELNFLGRYSDGSDNAIPFAFNGIHVISKNFFNIVSDEGFADIIDLYVKNKNRLNIKGYNAGGSNFIDIGKIENLAL